ncbi:tail completion protein gp17 [Novosphingobium guangzhouense]|uniref:DUF3168 domain-containing protein n=1 Tax=Novosphingobium guangzhouense TaxID=1850347 RepID=A0A2K2FUR9_9SPHN|nr:DUF3168 domain-containing protein [Novosphingobium guangzhouense]PNU02516.1 hypothetical protein A8V01_09050 [Novosphingobium guangzhouense]
MLFEEALTERLEGDSGVHELVAQRIHWGIRPADGELPCIVVTILADMRDQHLDGFNSLWETRVQTDCYAASRLQAAQLREAVIGAVVPAVEMSGHRFDRAHINLIADRGDDGTGKYTHRQLIDLNFWHGTTE